MFIHVYILMNINYSFIYICKKIEVLLSYLDYKYLMSKLIIKSNDVPITESTGLTPRLSIMRTRSGSGSYSPIKRGVSAESNIVSLRSFSGASSGSKRKRDDNVEPLVEPPVKNKKKEKIFVSKNKDTSQSKVNFDDSEIKIPPSFNIKNDLSVYKFIDSLKPSQLQKILDRTFFVHFGDIYTLGIYEYFKDACNKNGVVKKPVESPVEPTVEPSVEPSVEPPIEPSVEPSVEIIIPPNVNFEVIETVQKFIRSLNVQQLQKIIDRKFLIHPGDFYKISKFINSVCVSKEVKKTKKKLSNKFI